MGWNLTKSLSEIQDKYRVLNFTFTPDSNSAIGIIHDGSIPPADEDLICEMFPSWIRIEFFTASPSPEFIPIKHPETRKETE